MKKHWKVIVGGLLILGLVGAGVAYYTLFVPDKDWVEQTKKNEQKRNKLDEILKKQQEQ